MKVLLYLCRRSPFTAESSLINIATGVTAPPSVNVHYSNKICCVEAVVKDSGFLAFDKVWCVLCKGCEGCCIFCLYCDTWSCRCSCKESMNVSSCRCCIVVSCVDLVAVFNAAFCMTCSLLMLV